MSPEGRNYLAAWERLVRVRPRLCILSSNAAKDNDRLAKRFLDDLTLAPEEFDFPLYNVIPDVMETFSAVAALNYKSAT